MAPEIKSPALRKLVSATISTFHRGFNSSKCKTEAKLATSRIKLLRNKREAQVRQMRRDIAMLLESGKDDTARIRVEHVIREQNILAANEIIELFCELIVARLSIIAKQRECPADLREGISSLIYAAPRCSELPELTRISDIFEKKYGKDFVSAASDLRPDSAVNNLLIVKLSVRKPTGEMKLKILKEIAKEYRIEWDTRETELELLKPPEELIEGPQTFVSSTSTPTKTVLSSQNAQPNSTGLSPRYCDDKEGSTVEFKDTASAARAAAESAEKAISAAQAAAFLAKQNSHPFDQTTSSEFSPHDFPSSNRTDGPQRRSSNSSSQSHMTIDSSTNEAGHTSRTFNSQTLNRSQYMEDSNADVIDRDSITMLRMSNSSVHPVQSDIKFDDSDGLESESDEEDELESPRTERHGPPNRPAPLRPPPQRDYSEGKVTAFSNSDKLKISPVSRVHPNLPDYEEFAARFEALKSNRS
ncbi:uncharacterized protein [Typha angustifolia]|uniref:uncharacterized protein n=1 Tax=Typha angustifolia TaxID=59011 RepID=UPI003C2E8AF4